MIVQLKENKMSLEKLMKKDVYVLGPLELSPHNFAVGVFSYEAIKGKMSDYNVMRQKLYLKGNKDVADAIGSLDTRANTAEEALDTMTKKRNAALEKINELNSEIKKMKNDHAEEIKEIKKNKKTTSFVFEEKTEKTTDKNKVSK